MTTTALSPRAFYGGQATLTAYATSSSNPGLTMAAAGTATATNLSIVPGRLSFQGQYWTGAASAQTAANAAYIGMYVIDATGAAGLGYTATTHAFIGNMSTTGTFTMNRGQFINVDGGSANTLLGSETTGGTSFTGSLASDFIIKEPATQRILLGTHDPLGGIQGPSAIINSSGVTVPTGMALTTGTRSIVTGQRTASTNDQYTADIGTFSTTGGAMELRFHIHLAAPAAGTTASVTKVYEFAVNATMGTLSTWYKLLPADASANQQTTNDFALEVQRTGLNTFLFRLRQIAIVTGGLFTYTVETLGDTLVTYISSSTLTASPPAVTTLHPSNSLILAAGNVGIGTDTPTTPLHVIGASTFGTAIVIDSSVAGGQTAFWGNGGVVGATMGRAVGTIDSIWGVAAANNNYGTGTVAGDAIIKAQAGTLHVTVGTGTTVMQVTTSDVKVFQASLPRGIVTTMTPVTAQVTVAATAQPGTSVISGTVAVIGGRRYEVTVSWSGTTFGTVGNNMQGYFSITNGTGTAGFPQTSGSPAVGPAKNYYASAAANLGGPDHTAYFTATGTGNITLSYLAFKQAGTGAMTINAAATSPIQMWVKDIGV